MSRKIPKQMISDEYGVEIISLLFRLLEFENESVITVLFSALESLRTAFQDSSDEIGKALPLIFCDPSAPQLRDKLLSYSSKDRVLQSMRGRE
jgi:hypothetical protein